MKDLLIITGPNIELNHLSRSIEELGIKFDIVNMQNVSMQNIDQKKSYSKSIFVTSFQSLLPVHEQDFLKSHQIDEFLIINPDFDEYEDLIKSFEEKFPNINYTVYDERVYAQHGNEIYVKEHLDYLKKSKESFFKRLQRN